MKRRVINNDPIWGRGEESPRVKLIKLKHHELGLDAWTSERVGKLCQLLNCTLAELCAICGCYHFSQSYYHNRKWPVYLTIQFERYEKAAVKMKFGITETIGGGDLTFVQEFGEQLAKKDLCS